MIRVLQVLPGLNRGGLETFVMNVYRAIDRSQIQFDFLTNMEHGDYSEEIEELGGHIFYIPSRNKGFKRYCANLKSFFYKHGKQYRAVHYHESSLTSLEVLYYAKKASIPVRIMHSHNSSIMGNKLHYITHFLGKFFIKKLATHYYGCSDKAIKWMYQGTGVCKKAQLINNGIKTSDFLFDSDVRNDVRSKLNISNKIVIGHVGRFMEVKNHRFLLEIFNNLLKSNADYHLMLIGAGELENEMKIKAQTMNIGENISFLGVRKDINTLMMGMDVFVMPSLYEGLPVTLVEAQASGLPIVCSDTISMMSKITPHYFTCSLQDTIDLWCNKIETSLSFSHKRKESNDIVKKAGFDIETTVSFLSYIYSNCK